MRAGMICTKDKVVKNTQPNTQETTKHTRNTTATKQNQKSQRDFLMWVISLSFIFQERSNFVQSLQGMESEFTWICLKANQLSLFISAHSFLQVWV